MPNLLRLIILMTSAVVSCSLAFAQTLPADPTKPAKFSHAVVLESTGPSEFRVNSIKTSPQKNYAVVNGQVVSTGALVDGATVLAITREGVSLNVSGEEVFITLSERKGFSKIKSGN